MEKLFFDDPQKLLDVAICSLISFIALFIFIRISGKRTLSKLNAFDFIVSVSMGSTLSSMILAEVPLAQGVVALIIIILLQLALARLTTTSATLEKVLNSEPTLLYYEGNFLRKAMKKELITEKEILSEIRKFRLDAIESVKAVVLELNGEMTVVKKSNAKSKTSTDEFFE